MSFYTSVISISMLIYSLVKFKFHHLLLMLKQGIEEYHTIFKNTWFSLFFHLELLMKSRTLSGFLRVFCWHGLVSIAEKASATSAEYRKASCVQRKKHLNALLRNETVCCAYSFSLCKIGQVYARLQKTTLSVCFARSRLNKRQWIDIEVIKISLISSYPRAFINYTISVHAISFYMMQDRMHEHHPSETWFLIKHQKRTITYVTLQKKD